MKLTDFHQFGRNERRAKAVLAVHGQCNGTEPGQGGVAGAFLCGLVSVHQRSAVHDVLDNPVQDLTPLAEIMPGVAGS